MPESPVLSPQKVIKILEAKRFVLVRTRGSHHLYRHPETGRRVTVPVHAPDLPAGTLLEILRQAGIEREELEDLK